MTPKKKAEELFNKFRSQWIEFPSFHDNQGVVNGIATPASSCKKFAFIAVDEVMESLNVRPEGMDYFAEKKYWEDVKTEIEKL